MIRPAKVMLVGFGAAVLVGVAVNAIQHHWIETRQRWYETQYMLALFEYLDDSRKRDGVWCSSLDAFRKDLQSHAPPGSPPNWTDAYFLGIDQESRPVLKVREKSPNQFVGAVAFTW